MDIAQDETYDKEHKWRDHKRSSQLLSDTFYEAFAWTETGYQYFGSLKERYEAVKKTDERESYYGERYLKIDDCADSVVFVQSKDGRFRVYQCWFCKDRLCPMCNWRRALKLSGEITEIVRELKNRDVRGKGIFATLTAKNVEANEIGETISSMSKAFTRMLRFVALKPHVAGTIRATEVTYNAESDTWHVHIHAILWMKPSYFSRGYLNQKQWRALWKRALRVDYDPYIYIESIRKKRLKKGAKPAVEGAPREDFEEYGAILEVAKYPIKPGDYEKALLPSSDEFERELETPEESRARHERLHALEDGLYRKRLISFSGIFKEIRQALNQKDDDNLLDEEEPDEDTPMILAKWDSKKSVYQSEQMTLADFEDIENQREKKRQLAMRKREAEALDTSVYTEGGQLDATASFDRLVESVSEEKSVDTDKRSASDPTD